MKLDSFGCRGFFTFQQPVSIDLTKYPDGTLIAITGRIGRGKTALLEVAPASHHRVLPFRQHKPLHEFCSGSNAYLESVYSFDDGRRFRARLSIDATKRSSEAVLEEVLPDGRRVPLNKSALLKSYKAAVEKVFPSLEVLLASAFAAQDKAGSFITLEKAERKNLFGSLLGLGQYEVWAETARKAAALIDRRRAELTAALAPLAARTTDAIQQAIDDEAQRLQVAIGDVEERQRTIDADGDRVIGELTAARAAVQGYLDAMAAAAVVRERLRDAEAARDAAIRELELLAGAAERERASIHAARVTGMTAVAAQRATLPALETLQSRRDREAEAVRAQFGAERLDTGERLVNNLTLLADAAAVREAVSKRAQLEQRRAELGIERQTAQHVLARQDAELTAAAAEVRRRSGARSELQRAQEDAGLLASVPCGGAAPYDVCQFLRNATAAAARVPELEAAVRELEAAESREAWARTEIERTRTAIAALDEQIAFGDASLADPVLTKLAARAPLLEQAATRIDEYDEKLARINVDERARLNAVEAAHVERERERDSRLAALETQEATIAAEHAAAIAALDARHSDDVARVDARRDAALASIVDVAGELAAAEAKVVASQAAQATVERLEAELSELTRQQQDARVARASLLQQAEALHERREAVRATLDERRGIEQQLQTLAADQVEWQQLGVLFGNDGLKVLEIANAGPAVSLEVNNILQACFGPQFTVELVTQEAKKDGSGLKEAFDLKVWDAEAGGVERDLKDLSGGQRTIMDEALKGAIAIVRNRQNVQPIRTLFRDETAGQLDAETARQYVQMLRRIMQRGGTHTCLFVTHSPDLAAMADVRIEVGDDGAITIDDGMVGAAA